MRGPANHPRYLLTGRASAGETLRPVLRQVSEGGAFNTFNTRPPAVCLEVEDQSFHHNSAVMMPVLKSKLEPLAPRPVGERNLLAEVQPYYPDWYETFRDWTLSDEVIEMFEYHRRGMVVLAVCYLFLEANPSYRLLLAGHTDTTGSDAYNFELSDLRARNVDCLLTGDRDGWVTIAADKSKVEDIQLICRYVNRAHGWATDPGAIDDEMGPATESAIRQLQRSYNESFDQSIAVDGQVGPQTWGAIFDLYQFDLAGLLGVQVEDLAEYQSQLRYVDDGHHTIGCGERIPIDEAGRDNFRSAENRRVEFLFFDEDDLPDLTAHLSGGEVRSGPGGRQASRIYAPGAYRFLFIDPMWWTGGHLPPYETDREPRQQTIEGNLDHLPNPPDGEARRVEVFEPTLEEAIAEGLVLVVDDPEDPDADSEP